MVVLPLKIIKRYGELLNYQLYVGNQTVEKNGRNNFLWLKTDKWQFISTNTSAKMGTCSRFVFPNEFVSRWNLFDSTFVVDHLHRISFACNYFGLFVWARHSYRSNQLSTVDWSVEWTGPAWSYFGNNYWSQWLYLKILFSGCYLFMEKRSIKWSSKFWNFRHYGGSLLFCCSFLPPSQSQQDSCCCQPHCHSAVEQSQRYHHGRAAGRVDDGGLVFGRGWFAGHPLQCWSGYSF